MMVKSLKPDEVTSEVRVLRSLFSRMPSSPVIYDVGASNGGWTWQAVKVFPNAAYYLFEPMWFVSDAYRDDKLLPLIASPHNVTMKAVAVGNRDATITLHHTPDNVSSTTIDWPAAANLSEPVSIPMVRLDTLVADGQIKPPDLIKMDIQGGELLALQGAEKCLPNVKALVLETWITRGYGEATPLLHEVATYLFQFGLRLAELGDEFRLDDGTLYSIDACFVRD